MAIVLEVQEQPKVPEGEFIAKVIGVEEKTTAYGPAIKFTFQITEPGYERVLTGIATNKGLVPKSKLFRWLSAMGLDLVAGAQVIIDNVIDVEVVVEVAMGKAAEGKTPYANIINVKPKRRRVQPEIVTADIPQQPQVMQVQPVQQVIPAQPATPPPQAHQAPVQRPTVRVPAPATRPVSRTVEAPKANPFVKEVNSTDDINY